VGGRDGEVPTRRDTARQPRRRGRCDSEMSRRVAECWKRNGVEGCGDHNDEGVVANPPSLSLVEEGKNIRAEWKCESRPTFRISEVAKYCHVEADAIYNEGLQALDFDAMKIRFLLTARRFG